MQFENIKLEEINRFGGEDLLKKVNKKLTSIKEVRKELEHDADYRNYQSNRFLYLEFYPDLFCLYRNDEGKKEIDSLFNHITDTITIKDIEAETLKNPEKNQFYISFISTYYFIYEKYAEYTKFLSQIFKKLDNYDFILTGTAISISDIPCRREICTLYALLLSKTKKPRLETDCKLYIRTFQGEKAEDIEKFFNNKEILMMHQKIVKKYYEEKGKQQINNYLNLGRDESFLSQVETNPNMLEAFLDQICINENDFYYGIRDREDYRLGTFLEELDNNKEQLINVLRNFLKSKYSIGNKYANLQGNIEKMSRFLSILEYDSSLKDIVNFQ